MPNENILQECFTQIQIKIIHHEQTHIKRNTNRKYSRQNKKMVQGRSSQIQENEKEKNTKYVNKFLE